MKKNSIITVALSLAIVSSFSACGNSAIVFDIPTYVDDKQITIGAWSGSRHDLTDAELYNLKEAGFDLLVGLRPEKTSEVEALDHCAEFGINVLLDQRPGVRPWSGEVPEYNDRENFWGYLMYDEPMPGDLLTLKGLKEKFDEKMSDKMFFINLFPSGGVGDYRDYVSSYVNELGLPAVSYDNYSLFLDNETQEIYVRENYLYDFDVASQVAEEAGVPFWYTLLTSGHLNYTNPTVEELEWQMTLAMTYGAQGLVHYVYASHDPDYEDTIVDMSGNPTEQYYEVAEAHSRIRAWDHIYMNFDWLGTSNVEGKDWVTGLLDWTSNQVDVDEYGVIKSVESDVDVLVGHFEDLDKNAGFLVTNLTNPVESVTTSTTVTLASKYKGALVIDRGEERVVTLKNGKLDLEIEPGSGVFVIPLKEAK